MSMKFDRSEYRNWSEDGDVTISTIINDESLKLKAEWQYDCCGSRNTVDGLINGRSFVWNNSLRPFDLDNPNELRLLEQVIFLYVKIQLLEWKLEEVTNA